MAALDIELSLEGFILECKGHVVLKSAIGSDVIVTDEHTRLAQVEVARGEVEGRLLDSDLGESLHVHVHIVELEGSISFETIILLLLDVG